MRIIFLCLSRNETYLKTNLKEFYLVLYIEGRKILYGKSDNSISKLI